MRIEAAVVKQAHAAFEIEPAHLDAPRVGEVLIRLVATGICHTDMAVVDRTAPVPLPCVLGHEGAGVVEAIGQGVSAVAPGDHVVISFGSCGTCRKCVSGEPAYCASFSKLNMGGRRADGSTPITDASGRELNASFFGQSSFATFAVAPERNLVKVRRDVPLKFLGPLGCGFITGAGTVLNVFRPEREASLAVVGAGAVGFAALLAARTVGCRQIIAVDRVASRLALARDLGATHTIDTTSEDLGKALTALGGVDFVVETSGVPKLIEAAVGSLNPCGMCALIGAGPERKITFDVMGLMGGRVVMGVREGNAIPQILIPRLIDLFEAGQFPIDRLTRFYPFKDINQAVADALAGVAIKPVLTFE